MSRLEHVLSVGTAIKEATPTPTAAPDGETMPAFLEGHREEWVRLLKGAIKRQNYEAVQNVFKYFAPSGDLPRELERALRNMPEEERYDPLLLAAQMYKEKPYRVRTSDGSSAPALEIVQLLRQKGFR